MAVISASTLVFQRVFILWTIAFFLLKDPVSFLENRFILLTSRSMQLSLVLIDENETSVEPFIGIIGFALVLLGLSDVTVLLVPDFLDILDTLVPLRLTIYFAISAYSYLYDSKYLSNGLVFTFCFIEIVVNFLIFLSVREERNEFRKQKLRSRHESDDETTTSS